MCKFCANEKTTCELNLHKWLIIWLPCWDSNPDSSDPESDVLTNYTTGQCFSIKKVTKNRKDIGYFKMQEENRL